MKTSWSIRPEPNQKIAPRMWRYSRTARTQIMAARNLASALMSLHWTPARLPVRTVLEGELVRLEPLDAQGHAADLYAAQEGADEIWEYLPYGPFSGEAEFQGWLAARAATDDPLFFAIRSEE